MKTIIYKEIGSNIIIEKFDSMPIDGELTRISSQAAIQMLPEYKKLQEQVQAKTAWNNKKREAQAEIRRGVNYITNAEANFDGLSEQDKQDVLLQINRAKTVIDSYAKKEKEYKKQIDACDPELDRLNRIVDAEERRHKTESPIYCHPRKNEVIPNAEQLAQYKALFDGKGQNEQVKIQVKFVNKTIPGYPEGEIDAPFPELTGEPSIIADFIGCQYFFKDGDIWNESEVIQELGVVKTDVAPDFAVESKDLTHEQAEEIRVQKLTAEQKTAEKTAELSRVLAEATAMKTSLEIQGETAEEALADSRTWYNEQVALIEAKYA